jgi:hypothetical protein
LENIKKEFQDQIKSIENASSHQIIN